MKKIKVVLLLAMTTVLLASGCQKKEETEKVTETTKETTMETGTFEVMTEALHLSGRETPNANGEVHSYLTGALTDVNIAYRRPIAIMLNNIINACPQAGIANAGIVYEAPVEGNLTRLMGIFEDYKNLDKIGSVRSCRDYYVRYALEFNAVYTHFGQAVYAFDLLNSDKVDNISGLEYQEKAGSINGYAGEDIFYRTSDRPAPHNVYTSDKQIATAIQRKGYNTSLSEDYMGHYKFAEDGQIVTYTDGTATRIEPGYIVNKPWFEYNSTEKVYYRSQYQAEHVDQLTGKQLSYTNIIFQFSEWENYDDNGYLNVDTASGGEAIVFTQGTYQKGTWKKESESAPARYYDMNENEIVLNQGKTWVCILQDTYRENMNIQ